MEVLSPNCRVQCNKDVLERIQFTLGLTMDPIPVSEVDHISIRVLRSWDEAIRDSIAGRVLERTKLIEKGVVPDTGHQDRLDYERNWQLTIRTAYERRSRAEEAERNAARERQIAADKAKSASFEKRPKAEKNKIIAIRKKNWAAKRPELLALYRKAGIDVAGL